MPAELDEVESGPVQLGWHRDWETRSAAQSCIAMVPRSCIAMQWHDAAELHCDAVARLFRASSWCRGGAADAAYVPPNTRTDTRGHGTRSTISDDA
jgi:hypothetical protein